MAVKELTGALQGHHHPRLSVENLSENIERAIKLFA